jgi:transposase InsO family protein
MTTSERLARRRLSLLELGEYLENVSEACRVMGVSRQHFYELKKSYEEGGLEALKEKSRRVPNLKNRVAPEAEEAVLALALEYPAYGQVRAANELRKRGIELSPSGVRGVWDRHGLRTTKQRLRRLEAKVAAEGLILTEAQVAALEKVRAQQESSGESIETHHPGFLVSQDTFYVGYLKGVGRIYQQSVVDTYSAVAFAKLYTSKVPVTAADVLNDQVLPFFEAEEVPVLRMLTDRGTEFCGRADSHAYELFLELNEIEHTRTKARHPQTNGICERFHKTILGEFYQVAFRKKIYGSVEELQRDLDDWLIEYNQVRPHQGQRCQGRTPYQTFLDSKELVREKMLA